MRSWKRFWRGDDDEAKEVPCPRCGTPVPLNAMTCTACGWDPHEKYESATASGRSSGRPEVARSDGER